ncbi:hypothetical protein K7432_016609 [Basidiobolus ranarum]|uniref:Uncharacterized protein n=1 Tax=Basidiobolus ranarum TaxID=34480 RepID=A0ABR2VLN7_9FUNG
MLDKEIKTDSRDIGHEEGDIRTASDADMDGLRRVAGKIPLAAWFVVVNEFCERFAYYGGSAPFTNYIQFPAGDPKQAGALNMGQATSTAWKQFFTFFCYLTPLIGAVVADHYRYSFYHVHCWLSRLHRLTFHHRFGYWWYQAFGFTHGC